MATLPIPGIILAKDPIDFAIPPTEPATLPTVPAMLSALPAKLPTVDVALDAVFDAPPNTEPTALTGAVMAFFAILTGAVKGVIIFPNKPFFFFGGGSYFFGGAFVGIVSFGGSTAGWIGMGGGSEGVGVVSESCG